MTDFDTMRTRLARFRQPEQYFVGQARYAAGLPDNILFFTREYEVPPGSSWCSRQIIGQTSEICSKAARHNRVAHHRHVMLLPFRGEGMLLLNDDRFSIRPGQIVYILPHQLHMMIASESILWLYITFEMESYDAFQGFADRPVGFPEEARGYLDELLDCPVREKGGDLFAGMRAALNILQILNTIMERQSSDRIAYVPKMDSFIDRINSILCRNLEKDIDLAEIAAQFHYSPNHLRKLYRDGMGIPLGSYLRNLRHAHALNLLCSTALPLETIARRCGFGSAYAFSAAFRSREGCPPGEYRKRFRNVPDPDK